MHRRDSPESRRQQKQKDDGYRQASDRYEDRRESRWNDQKERHYDDERRSDRDSSGRSRSRWDSRDDGVRKSSSSTHTSEDGCHSRSTGGRSRSRSRSPFARNASDLSGYANPSRGSAWDNTNASRQIEKRSSNWSESSDDGDNDGRLQGRQSLVGASTMPFHERGGPTMSSNSNDTVDISKSIPGPGLSLKLNDPKSSAASAVAKLKPLPKILSVPAASVKPTKVASVFNDSDDDEPEEMPPECKMRMKNVGRETRTSEGPNSFGKTKIGFCNLTHLAEKRLEGKGETSKKKFP